MMVSDEAGNRICRHARGVRPAELAAGDKYVNVEIGLSLLGPLFPPSKLNFLCREALAFSPLRTPDPPLCQMIPVGIISSAARQFGHGFAIGGKP
jgi:hypothetical protein